MPNISDIKQQVELLSRDARHELLDWLFDHVDLQTPVTGVAEARASYVEPGSRPLTLEEYLELEERSTLRHEYVNGAVYAMSGATVVHNQITFQLATAISRRLRGGPCKVFLNDLKLRLDLGSDEIIYYPDVMVACRPEEWGKNFIRNPKLVAEVLSSSTQHIDRREKALNYHRAGTIEEYLVLSQTEGRVLVHRRGARWEVETICGAEAAIQLRSLGVSIPLKEIYGDAVN